MFKPTVALMNITLTTFSHLDFECISFTNEDGALKRGQDFLWILPDYWLYVICSIFYPYCNNIVVP